jgi:hypothetical protein
MKEDIRNLKGEITKHMLTPHIESRTTDSQSHVVDITERKDNKQEEILTNVIAVDKFTSTSDFPLPLFSENSINPVFHLKQLDTYIKLKNIPNECKLSIVFRSLNGITSKQWAETMVNQFTNYENFKQEFLKVWWSTSQQSLVKCSLYQDKYNQQSNLTLSAHFLKYTTLASYLNPKPSEVEIIEALRYHYPPHIQRTLLNNQLKTIGETLEILRRLELMESKEQSYRKSSSDINLNRDNKGYGNNRKFEP